MGVMTETKFSLPLVLQTLVVVVVAALQILAQTAHHGQVALALSLFVMQILSLPLHLQQAPPQLQLLVDTGSTSLLPQAQ
jgi:hypothetical protein